jgi:hypothetical protein
MLTLGEILSQRYLDKSKVRGSVRLQFALEGCPSSLVLDLSLGKKRCFQVPFPRIWSQRDLNPRVRCLVVSSKGYIGLSFLSQRLGQITVAGKPG